MEERSFEPQYWPRRFLLPLVSLVPGVLGMGLTVVLGGGREVIVVCLLMTILPLVFFLAGHVRRVVFGKDLIVVRSPLRDRYYNYQQFIRVERERVITPRGPIVFGTWKNRRAFLEMIRLLCEEGRFEKDIVAPGVFDEIQ